MTARAEQRKKVKLSQEDEVETKLLVRKSFLLSKSLMHPQAHMQANMMIYVCSSVFFLATREKERPREREEN